MPTYTTNAPLNFCGSIATIRLSHEGEPDGLSVIEHHLPFGYAPPLHIHLNQDEFFHILTGSLCVEVGGELINAGPGDILRAPKGVPHRFIVVSEGGARALVMTVGPEFERFVREGSEPLPAGRADFPRAPLPEEIALVSAAAIRNELELIGPPLTLADISLQAA
jgi:mannose-6-phosphate isomerase-like protein (cupin superfamily)